MKLGNRVWADGFWNLGFWADNFWLESGAGPTILPSSGGGGPPFVAGPRAPQMLVPIPRPVIAPAPDAPRGDDDEAILIHLLH